MSKKVIWISCVTVVFLACSLPAVATGDWLAVLNFPGGSFVPGVPHEFTGRLSNYQTDVGLPLQDIDVYVDGEFLPSASGVTDSTGSFRVSLTFYVPGRVHELIAYWRRGTDLEVKSYPSFATIENAQVSIYKFGTGSGLVRSTDDLIDCGSSCTASYDAGTSVTLRAFPAKGSTFGGWGGACSSESDECTFVLSGYVGVYALFHRLTSGHGTPFIDGHKGPSEWEGAAEVPIQVSLPNREGGGTIPATLRVMNDQDNIYVMVELQTLRIDVTFLTLDFDSDLDGIPEQGDDALFADFDTRPNADPPAFFDEVSVVCSDADPSEVFAGCSAEDIQLRGTADGLSAASAGDGIKVIEMLHPLNTEDDAHDFSLSTGSVITFSADVGTWSGDYCSDWSDCYGWGSVENVGFVVSAA